MSKQQSSFGPVPGNKTEKHWIQGQCQEIKRKSMGHRDSARKQNGKAMDTRPISRLKREGNGRRANIWTQNGKAMDTGPASGFKTER
jgi:hypothetical protein